MMKEKQVNKPYDLSLISIIRGFALVLIPLSVYIIAAFPVILVYLFLSTKISYTGILYYLLLTVILVFGFFFLIIFETFIPGIFIRLFRIRVNEGKHGVSIRDKAFFIHLLFFTLYRPSLHLIGIIPLVPLRLLFLKLVGLRIGKTSLIGGTELIDEPYAVRIGEHSLIGGYVTIFSHISFQTMINKRVVIGNHCFIGNKSLIMPGVIIEDHVTVEPGTVVPMDMTLKKGKTYWGNPAVERNK